jgi:hypothetical protein
MLANGTPLSDLIAWGGPRSWKSCLKAVMARFSRVDSRASQSRRKREAWSVTVSGKQYRPLPSSAALTSMQPRRCSSSTDRSMISSNRYRKQMLQTLACAPVVRAETGLRAERVPFQTRERASSHRT